MSPGVLLQLAFIANILILVPVCYSVLLGAGVATVFDGIVEESKGLRLLVGSLWSAILIASIAGLIAPRFFAPVLLIQVIYKSLWLALFVAPSIIEGRPWPVGISVIFLLIVLIYPFLFWFGFCQRTG